MAFWKPGSAAPIPSSESAKKPAIAQKSSGNVKSNVISNNTISKPPGDKIVLSKSVMSMKFMKKKEEAVINEAAEQLKFEQINNSSNWVSNAMDVEEDDGPLCCIKDTSDTFSALPGRRSFGGFNKAVEKNYQQVIDRKRFQKEAQPEVALENEEEMLLKYDSLVSLPRGPNQGVRQEVKASTKFNSNASSSSSGHNNHVSSSNAPHHSKNKSLVLGGGHKGAVMEEVVHFEDRKGKSNAGAKQQQNQNNHNQNQQHNKRKFENNSNGNSENKKKMHK